MDPIIEIAFFAVEEAIKLEPSIEAEIKDLLNKGNPTAEDWAACRARVLQRFEVVAPNSAAQILAGVPFGAPPAPEFAPALEPLAAEAAAQAPAEETAPAPAGVTMAPAAAFQHLG